MMSHGSGTSLILGRHLQGNHNDDADPWDDPPVEVGACPVTVCLRLRPMTRLERNRRSRSCIEVDEGGRNFVVDSPLDGEFEFCFDHAFDVDTPQEEIYETSGISVVENLLAGVNCAVLVYGLKGSGKSHTLVGKLPDAKDDVSVESSDDDSATTEGTPNEQDSGVALRIISDLFRGMKDTTQDIEFRVTCSFVCIYLEKMIDLLDPRFDKHLFVRDTSDGIQIEGAVEAFCFSEEDVFRLLQKGTTCRKIVGTKLKVNQNRSHAILTLNVEQRHTPTGCVKRSYLQVAELAGFEVSSKAKGQSVQETKIIHKSFSALGNVIKSLTEGSRHAPYRESKLTSILKEALGGNCKTTLFITASPSSYNISETINSIRLGQRVRRVTNKTRVNKDSSISDYRKWVLQSEARLGELTAYMKDFARQMIDLRMDDKAIERALSASGWHSLQVIASDEDVVNNPCRKSVILEADSDPNVDKPKWRALTLALAEKVPPEELVDAVRSRDRAESMLSDFQSESVVLRRQHELLVQERRKKEDELAAAGRNNRELKLRNSELEQKLSLAESRAKESIAFLRYMRTLCWRLRKDIEKDRPIEISEITSSLNNAPDLTGLVDLDTLMIDAGILITRDMDMNTIEDNEKEFFDYIQEAGLILDDNKPDDDNNNDNNGDDDNGGDEDEGNGNGNGEGGQGEGFDDIDDVGPKWRSREQNDNRSGFRPDGSAVTESSGASSQQRPNLFGLNVPWLREDHHKTEEEKEPHPTQRSIVRNTRREHELQRDLQNMANKCVELQVALNEQHQIIEGMSNRMNPLGSVGLKKRKVSPEVIAITKERDRMMHNALTAAWKLHEVSIWVCLEDEANNPILLFGGGGRKASSSSSPQ